MPHVDPPTAVPASTGAATEATEATEAASAPAQASSDPAAGAPAADRPQIGSTRWITHIWSSPARPKNHLPIGSIRFGTSIPLKSLNPVPGGNCRAKWYAVEPVGYVCADETTTFDFDSPYWKALASAAPKPGPWPYRYAFSTGAPMYMRVPTPQEQERAERGMGPLRTFKTLGKWSYGHERLVSTDPADTIVATDEIPEFFRDHRSIPGSPWNPAALPKLKVIPNGSGFAYAKAFEAAGRTWLLTPELLLVPADRAFPYKPSSFQGVALGGDVQLPLAWVRSDVEKKLRRQDDGTMQETGEVWTGKAHVPLTGNTLKINKITYHETREPKIWMAETDGVSVTRAATELPRTIGAQEKWIEARLLPGTMVAYVGLTPAWTTLWSGGKGGVPIPGRDPKFDATTEMGTFSFQWKDAVATMSPDKGAVSVFWFADVPHIQYVHAPLALHASYWHADFGYLRSAECLNLSPTDADWLFSWTLPALPAGWASVRPSKLMGASTKIVIRPR
jgi:hypothetical protein